MTRLSELNTELDRVAPALARATEMQALIDQGRRLRAEFFSNSARRAVQATRRGLTTAGMHQAFQGFTRSAVVRAWNRRHTMTELNRLSDRMLADIGLSRGEIPYVAAVLAAAPRAVTQRRAKPAGESLFARMRHAQRRRKTVRELEQLPDRILADIGINRSQIPAAVDRLMQKQQPTTAAVKTKDLSVRDLLTHVENAIRPLRQWHLSRLAAGQIARLGNATLSDIGYVKGDVDWVPEVLANRKIANTPTSTRQRQAGAA